MGINWNSPPSTQSTDEDNQWEGVDALAVVVGKDDVLYAKSTALQVRRASNGPHSMRDLPGLIDHSTQPRTPLSFPNPHPSSCTPYLPPSLPPSLAPRCGCLAMSWRTRCVCSVTTPYRSCLARRRWSFSGPLRVLWQHGGTSPRSSSSLESRCVSPLALRVLISLHTV